MATEDSMKDYDPQFPMCLFGDGSQAEVRDMSNPWINEEGITMISLVLWVGKRIIKEFNVKQQFLITKHYRKEFVYDLYRGASGGTMLILCDYEGKGTPLTKLHEELLDQIKELQFRIQRLKLDKIKLNKELKDTSENIMERFKDLSDIQSIIKQPVKEKKEDDDDTIPKT